MAIFACILFLTPRPTTTIAIQSSKSEDYIYFIFWFNEQRFSLSFLPTHSRLMVRADTLSYRYIIIRPSPFAIHFWLSMHTYSIYFIVLAFPFFTIHFYSIICVSINYKFLYSFIKYIYLTCVKWTLRVRVVATRKLA